MFSVTCWNQAQLARVSTLLCRWLGHGFTLNLIAHFFGATWLRVNLKRWDYYARKQFWRLFKELENGRLFRLISKMSMVQCQPPAGAVLGQEQSWSESGERRLVRLFRNYLFRQRTDQGNPFLSISHVISSLNKVRWLLPTTRTNMNQSSTSGPTRRLFSTRMTTEQSSLQRTMTLNLQSTRWAFR